MRTSIAADPQVSLLVDPSKPQAVLKDAKRFLRESYPDADLRMLERAFVLTKRLFDGRFPGYQACAVEYHNYAHTISVFAAASRLLDGCALAGMGIDSEIAAEVLIAALLHDSGYIKEEGDGAGTGAQYTKVHVDRSAAFALREAEAFRLEPEQAARISRMILGTDLARPLASLERECRLEDERQGIEILAAADLLGQMSDRAYIEKLLFLYYEFREAGIEGYASAFDILRKTAGFYESTKARLDGPLGRVSGRSREHFAARYGIDRDLYREAIERQMAYLDSILADDTTNFRSKLKRLDLASIERAHGESY
jgi:hypothetical protein